MASTKVRTNIASGVVMTASAGNVNSTAIDLSAGYGAQLDIQITNGGTGPTIAGQAQIQVANDVAGTLFTNFGGPLTGGVSNNGVSSWSIDIPIGVARLRIVSGSNTGQATTLDADISQVTGI